MHLSDTQPTNLKKNLGKTIAVYRGQPFTWRIFFFQFIPVCLLVLTPLVYGFWRATYARINFGSAPAETWSKPWYQLSIVGLIPLVWLSFYWIRRSHRIVQVCQNGIRIQQTKRQRYSIPWEGISGVAAPKIQDSFLGIKIRDHTRVTIYPTVGKPFRLSRQIPNLDELCARIKAKIYPRLLKELRSAFDAGTNLYFGDLIINRSGIKLKKHEHHWNEVSLINIRAGSLVVELKNQRSRKVPVGDIPNIELALQLIQEGVEV